MDAGCYTALVTPFTPEGGLDTQGLDRLINYQVKSGITGILAVGTTGESPTLKWEEHNQVIAHVAAAAKDQCLCIAGTGSNNTQEALYGAAHAQKAGADAVLLVDPYYNGPSSLEIRKEYIEPIAEALPDLTIIPYIIPGRTGAQLLPEDLAILAETHKNVTTVKEATGNLDNMKRTRFCCPQGFTILSGDDGLTFEMMTDPDIRAAGVISVISNLIPKALTDMTALLNRGETEEADKIQTAITPLMGLVTITTMEETPFGPVTCRARNPLAIKTLMQILGMPSGHCRQPIGKMTEKGLAKVLEITRTVQKNNPEILQPIADFFDIDIQERLTEPRLRENLTYGY
ncbi:MAG: 4-hydroxy-tetrahydrodipicolinate synthase [Desulfobacteraceae bacterium 4572_89]|nr:MAG: 4-hydroxy-tetrahydrodipicolinate synthase [Desulfobacteraceae bacterium 4572_89]